MARKRILQTYSDENPESILDISCLINSILDLIEFKSGLEDDYLKTRIKLMLECFGLQDKINLHSHIERTLLDDLIERRTQLEIKGLSRLQGILEVDLGIADVAAAYKTLTQESARAEAISAELSELNYSFLLNYFKELDNGIEQASCKLSDLTSRGLATQPIWDQEEW